MYISRKDRIAIVISLLWFLVISALAFSENELTKAIAASLFFALVPLTLYWGTRFIRNNISFMNFERQTSSDRRSR